MAYFEISETENHIYLGTPYKMAYLLVIVNLTSSGFFALLHLWIRRNFLRLAEVLIFSLV